LEVLLLCDFQPGLLANVLGVYDSIQDVDILLITRSAPFPTGSKVKVFRIPLPVFGSLGGNSLTNRGIVLFNTFAYLLSATLLGTFLSLRHRCGIIHSRFLYPQALVGLVVSKFTRARLFMTAEGSDIQSNPIGLLSKFVLPTLSNHGEIIAVSKTIQSQLAGVGVSSICLPNCVDSTRFSFVPLEKKGNLLLTLGTLTESKKQGLVIEAVNLMSDFLKQQRIEVAIVGDGPLRDELEARITSAGLQQIVKLIGFVAEETKLEYLRLARIYVTCSRGMVALLEAMATGCVAIASDIPDNAEIVVNQKTGILFSANDAHSLAQSIIFVLEHPSLASEISLEASRVIRSEYSVEAYAHRLFEAYSNPRGRTNSLLSERIQAERLTNGFHSGCE
jgi:glycosyltransferase involved in cell wall biosynthesis